MSPPPATDRWQDRCEMVAIACGCAIFEWDPASDAITWDASPSAGWEFAASSEETLSAWAAAHVAAPAWQQLVDTLSAAAQEVEPVGLPLRLEHPGTPPLDAILRALPHHSPAGLRFVVVLTPDARPRRETAEPAPAASRHAGATVERGMQTIRHMVNNRLASMLGQTQLLSEEAAHRDDPGLQSALRSLLLEGEKIAQTVEELTQNILQETASGEPASEGPAASQAFSMLRLMLEHLPAGLLVCDTSRVIQFANAALQQISGFSSAELIGRRIDDVLLRGTDAEAIRENFTRHLADDHQSFEARLHRKHGDPACVQVSTGAFRDDAGEPLGVLYTVTDLTARMQSERELRESALHDTLTGLANRALLQERLTNAIARATRHAERHFAVLFVDVDHLKSVNDTLGHAAGDQLLVTVARRLLTCLRPEDTVARFGGDEFAILVEGIQDSADATRVALRILGELQAPVDVGQTQIASSASIGIAIYDSSVTSPDALLRNADAAMYRAKARGRGTFEIFDQTMQAEIAQRMHNEDELREAIDESQFRLHYQPIVALASGRVVGIEALLRWAHPARGLLEPAAFLPLAEDSGLILPIGDWALRHATAQLRAWKDEFGARAPLWVGVNVSPKQLLQPGFTRQVTDALRAADLDPASLRIDVSESLIAGQRALAWAAINDLHAIGVRVHMDDFGTGSSPLGDLHQLPIEAMKIDRSFVERLGAGNGTGTLPGDQPGRVVRTLLDVVQGVGVSAIAEGVTTVEQATELRRLGCQFAQGYLFARPLDDESIHTLISIPHPPRGE